jgi:hypothetical protein
MGPTAPFELNSALLRENSLQKHIKCKLKELVEAGPIMAGVISQK